MLYKDLRVLTDCMTLQNILTYLAKITIHCREYLFYLYFMDMDVLTDLYPYTTYMQYLWRPEEGIGFPRSGVTKGGEFPCG